MGLSEYREHLASVKRCLWFAIHDCDDDDDDDDDDDGDDDDEDDDSDDGDDDAFLLVFLLHANCVSV